VQQFQNLCLKGQVGILSGVPNKSELDYEGKKMTAVVPVSLEFLILILAVFIILLLRRLRKIVRKIPLKEYRESVVLMSEKKVVSRKVAIALGIICIALVVILVGVTTFMPNRLEQRQGKSLIVVDGYNFAGLKQWEGKEYYTIMYIYVRNIGDKDATIQEVKIGDIETYFYGPEVVKANGGRVVLESQTIVWYRHQTYEVEIVTDAGTITFPATAP